MDFKKLTKVVDASFDAYASPRSRNKSICEHIAYYVKFVNESQDALGGSPWKLDAQISPDFKSVHITLTGDHTDIEKGLTLYRIVEHFGPSANPRITSDNTIEYTDPVAEYAGKYRLNDIKDRISGWYWYVLGMNRFLYNTIEDIDRCYDGYRYDDPIAAYKHDLSPYLGEEGCDELLRTKLWRLKRYMHGKKN